MFKPLIFLFDLIAQYTASNTRINKYAEIGSPRRDNLPYSKYLSSRKYQILICPLHLKIYLLRVHFDYLKSNSAVRF